MKPDPLREASERLGAAGWDISARRLFRPLLGRYWQVRAWSGGEGGEVGAARPTVRIALKKLQKMLDHYKAPPAGGEEGPLDDD